MKNPLVSTACLPGVLVCDYQSENRKFSLLSQPKLDPAERSHRREEKGDGDDEARVTTDQQTPPAIIKLVVVSNLDLSSQLALFTLYNSYPL